MLRRRACPLRQARCHRVRLARCWLLVDAGRVMLVDEATGQVKWAVQAHIPVFLPFEQGEPCSTLVARSPSGRFVASVGNVEENLKLWDAASGAERMAGARHNGTGACICEVEDLGHRVVQE